MFAKLAAFTALMAVLASAAPIQEEKRITHTGQATYYAVGLGACGWENSDSDMVVALNQGQYQANNGGNCGQYLTITDEASGNTVVAQVVDECPGCAWGSLDMSPALFSALHNGNMDAGVFPISWHFNHRN